MQINSVNTSNSAAVPQAAQKPANVAVKAEESKESAVKERAERVAGIDRIPNAVDTDVGQQINTLA